MLFASGVDALIDDFSVGVETFVIGPRLISSFFSVILVSNQMVDCLPLTCNSMWFFKKVKVYFFPIRLSNNFMTLKLDLHRMMSGFQEAFATDVACQHASRERLPFRTPGSCLGDLIVHVLQLLKPDFSNLTSLSYLKYFIYLCVDALFDDFSVGVETFVIGPRLISSYLSIILVSNQMVDSLPLACSSRCF